MAQHVENPVDQLRDIDRPLRVLEQFASRSDVGFDRILANRAMGQAIRAIPGEGFPVWGQRMVEAGETLDLRVRFIECTLDDALSLVSEGVPVVTAAGALGLSHRPGGPPEGSANGPNNGEPEEEWHDDEPWYLLVELKGNRVRLAALDDGERDRWVSVRELRSRLKLSGGSATRKWVISQAAFGCHEASKYSEHLATGKPASPFARLWGLLQPDRKDLWTILIFSVFVGALALATPVAVEALVNTVAFGRYLQPIFILAILLFTFLAFAAAMQGLINFVVEIIQRRVFLRVVEDLAYRLPRIQQSSMDGQHAPELVNRFFDVVTVQKTVAKLLLDGSTVILQTFIGMAILAFYHPFLLGFDVILIALIAVAVFGLGRGAVKTATKESKAKYAVAAWLQELGRHSSAFKLNGANQFALDRADQLAVNWLDARRNHFSIVIRQVLFALGLQAFAATALLGLGGWLVIQGELTLGQLVAAELIVMIILRSFAKLGKQMESWYDLLASVDKLGVLFDLPVEPHDKLFHLRTGAPAAVQMHRVTCKRGGKTVLQNLNLNVEAGESLAVVGPAGSGKTTLVDILCGLRSPDSGHVELDRIDLRELRPDSLREHLSVARGVEIFHGTIDENVHMNRPHISALDVRQALSKVGLLDELLKLPDGLNTVLQTGGKRLSSDHATRLMLARAIVDSPRLLLIDGTLDVLSDDDLAAVLPRLVGPESPWTTFVTTGRKAVEEACDRSLSLTASESN